MVEKTEGEDPTVAACETSLETVAGVMMLEKDREAGIEERAGVAVTPDVDEDTTRTW